MKIGRSLLTQKTKAIAKTILNHLYVTENNILNCCQSKETKFSHDSTEGIKWPRLKPLVSPPEWYRTRSELSP
ncbi:hypothetical protein Peur_012660 [Populus x canadensis]